MLLSQPLVDQFIAEAVKHGDYELEDRFYLQNQILRILKAEGVDSRTHSDNIDTLTPSDIVQEWIRQAVDANVIDDLTAVKDITEAALMDLITPRPSRVNQIFHEYQQISAEKATQYFYDLSQRNHYVKADAIAKNINFEVPTSYGDMEITINLSKPEKSAKDIALARKVQSSDYPKCALCMENEGFVGSMSQPARSNHRIIRLELGNETWGFQYSPYAYFQEHSIILSETHTPMSISKQTFVNLLDFVDQFPHYFIGSNADIPLVGGSILSHRHYQAGRHVFPMERAEVQETFRIPGFERVSFEVLNWPMSVLCLKSQDRHVLVEAGEFIRQQWNEYSDASVGIKAYDDEGERHHTITPIVRYDNGQYRLYIVLRDNQTSEAFPDGVFHPHPDVQHIKRENIGLIEVMGTAILPGRLKEELSQVKAYLLGETNVRLGVHQTWAEEMKRDNDFDETNVDQLIKTQVGLKFKRILEDAGVFKLDQQGRAAFQRFITRLIEAHH